MTERLFRTIFNDPDFTRRNVIAAEIEKVIQALTSRSFNRGEFLKSLDRFYVAIEGAARNLDDWVEKQHFLNTVYERFFQGFSIKQADTYGIVYTPQEIVDFMCTSVDEVLQREFSSSLSQPRVQILDPCTGTGNFIVNLIQRISGSCLSYKYANDLFCNEIMLLPYYIASLNIEHAYYERTGEYKPFEGICFADTLELAEGRQMQLFVEKNTARVEREKSAQIMVLIGNPPYNVGQKNENDNNKNRRYPIIDERIRETYAKNSHASNKNALSDAYVKFFRWATDRLEGHDGIVCFVSNNGFLNGIAFDGFRKGLLEDFTQIYHLDLKGNARTSGERRKAEGGNIFDDKIRTGIGITILVRSRHHQERKIWYQCVDDFWSAKKKREYLQSHSCLSSISWQPMFVDKHYNWLLEGLPTDFTSFLPMGTKEIKSAHDLELAGRPFKAIFKVYSQGAQTGRDDWMYDFDANRLIAKSSRMIETYDAELSRWIHAGSPKDVDNFVLTDETKIKWSSRLKECLARKVQTRFQTSAVRNSLYRPFTHRFLYFDNIMTHRRGMFPIIFPRPSTETENVVICVAGLGDRKGFGCLATNIIPSLDLAFEKAQCFPFYTYADDGSNRRENITDWTLVQFQACYGEQVSKHDIFHYVYALLHHPQYRSHYAENLKRELPRIPLLRERSTFEQCVNLGQQLMELHLHYEQATEYPLKWIENKNVLINWYVEKMRLSSNKHALVVNEWLTLTGIPQVCFQYRLGNLSALEWVIDQYQVSVDKRSGIVSDPNREEDPEYIVRLVGRVVTVSVETVRLVEELAQAVKMEDWMDESAT